MHLLSATIRGSLKEAMTAEVRDVARGLRCAVTSAGAQVQSELRAQARAAGFRDGGRAVANAWRLRVYPAPGVADTTFKPAALVFSKMSDVVDAFDRGATIVARNHQYLAFPTGYNQTGGRLEVRVPVTQMIVQAKRGRAFVIPSKRSPNVSLWCLRPRSPGGWASAAASGFYVGSGVQVVTGHRKGQQARLREVLAQGFVPMYFLMRRVSLRKRLDIAAVRAQAGGFLAAAVVRELRQ